MTTHGNVKTELELDVVQLLFVWSKTSYSGDVTDTGQDDNKRQGKIELLSFDLESAEFRNLELIQVAPPVV